MHYKDLKTQDVKCQWLHDDLAYDSGENSFEAPWSITNKGAAKLVFVSHESVLPKSKIKWNKMKVLLVTSWIYGKHRNALCQFRFFTY
jgi:hypothetical protein